MFVLGELVTAGSRPEGRVYKVETRLDEIITKWRVAWEQKTAQEFRARLNLWRDFLEEYRQNQEANADRYPYEVQRRVMIDLLEVWSADISRAESELLSALDQLLKSVWIPGDFIWDDNLAPGFPPDRFWYLYGGLKS
jgi:hypothetical protein